MEIKSVMVEKKSGMVIKTKAANILIHKIIILEL